MAVLANARHERFVQELAKGKTADEAYQEAGYKPNRHNAATLGRSQHISTRLAELQERAAIRTEITVANITERLLNIAKKGEGSDEAPLLSVARASLMDAAKLNGLVVDRQALGGDAAAPPIQVIERRIVPAGKPRDNASDTDR